MNHNCNFADWELTQLLPFNNPYCMYKDINAYNIINSQNKILINTGTEDYAILHNEDEIEELYDFFMRKVLISALNFMIEPKNGVIDQKFNILMNLYIVAMSLLIINIKIQEIPTHTKRQGTKQ